MPMWMCACTGNLDCDRRPGQLGHEKQDAEYFAKVGVDWFKEDSCYDSGNPDVAIKHYAAMRDAFNGLLNSAVVSIICM